MEKVILTEMKKNEREEKRKKELACKFIRINFDAENYDIRVEIGKIHVYIAQSNVKKIGKELKEKLEKELKEKLKKELKEKLEKKTKRKIRKRS